MFRWISIVVRVGDRLIRGVVKIRVIGFSYSIEIGVVIVYIIVIGSVLGIRLKSSGGFVCFVTIGFWEIIFCGIVMVDRIVYLLG